jgi:hypothetical protein
MLVCEASSRRGMEGAGLMAGYYYDPYPPRFSANLKEMLAKGARMLVRLHAGVRYPMSERERIEFVDREGQVVAVVGYESDDRILLADPWDVGSMGGRDGGLRSVDHRDLAMRWVNSTADKAIVVFPLDVSLTTSSLGERASTVRADVSLRAPAPQIRLAATLLEDVAATIRLPAGLELLGEARSRVDVLGAGETASFSWDVREVGPVDGVVRVAVAAIAKGTDPYPFQDVVGTEARAELRSVEAPVPVDGAAALA